MTKYIRKNKNSFTIIKNSKNYGNFKSIDEAIFIRDLLIDCDWKLNKIDNLYYFDDRYFIVSVTDEKVCIISKYQKKPSQSQIENLIKKHKRNPNNSKYGLNISKIFDTFIIKKQIVGDEYIFGYYDNLEDATFIRDFLIVNNWNVNEFSQIEFDSENNSYKIIEVVDDKVYVIDNYKSKEDIDLEKSRMKFLNKISKHNLGLANHDYLHELTCKIEYLEDKFKLKVNDSNWNLQQCENPLNEIIFNLTPWQKIVLDVIGEETSFEDIKKSLSGYKSKNFDKKVKKYLDELIDLGLVSKDSEGKFSLISSLI